MHRINELEHVFSLTVKRMLVRECSEIHLFSFRLCNWSKWSMNSSGNLEIWTEGGEGEEMGRWPPLFREIKIFIGENSLEYEWDVKFEEKEIRLSLLAKLILHQGIQESTFAQ